MQFVLGIIVGLVIAVLVAVLIAFFRAPIGNTTERLYREIQENARQSGFGQKGFIIEPKPEVDIMRERRIAENSAKGQDTRIDELR